ncbi:MAG: PEGA domain-containing protein [Planctomycetes bacterium]|jgi:hypothetical protein|nr:PEGA domain-containing protein [Planctomycetota bacterium]
MSLRPLLLPLLLLLPACTWWTSQDRVLITSDPLGARITVDGTDTGQTTPAKIAVAGNFGRDHTVTLQKRGYRPAQRRLYQFTEGYTAKWIDGAYSPELPPLPLFWTGGDFVFPFGIRGALLPAELHVQLQREDEPLLGFDLLAEQATATAGQAAAATKQP